MIIGLWMVCIIGFFGESIASNSEGRIKFVSLNNQPCQASPHSSTQTLMKLFFIHLLLMLISVVGDVILLMIHILEYVF